MPWELTHPDLEMASPGNAGLQDYDRAMLVRLVTIDSERGENGLPNTTEEKQWITRDCLLIRHQRLHVQWGGELYDVQDLRDQEKYTGNNMMRATRWKD